MGFEPTTSSLGSWHSTTELRPQTYFLNDKGVTRLCQVPFDPVEYAFNPFGCRYLHPNFQITSRLEHRLGGLEGDGQADPGRPLRTQFAQPGSGATPVPE